jgi:hypothetical protein
MNLLAVSRLTGVAFIIFSVMLLSGCASYDRAQRCQAAAGPEPNGWAGAFGLIGGLVNASTTAHQEWAAKVDACMAAKKATDQANNQ